MTGFDTFWILFIEREVVFLIKIYIEHKVKCIAIPSPSKTDEDLSITIPRKIIRTFHDSQKIKNTFQAS